MSEKRKYLPDLTYSEWHRTESTSRFIGYAAFSLGFIDLDGIEYIRDNGRIVALIEAARYVGKLSKASTIMRNLALQADIPAYVVLYEISDTINPVASVFCCEKCGHENPVYDISVFHVRQVAPCFSHWHDLSPTMWATFLLEIRQPHNSIYGLDEWVNHERKLAPNG